MTLAASSSGQEGVADMTYHQLTQEERYLITAHRMCGRFAGADCPVAAAPPEHHRPRVAAQCDQARWRLPRREGAQLRHRPPPALSPQGAQFSAGRDGPGGALCCAASGARSRSRACSGRQRDAAHQPRDDLPPHPLGQAGRRGPVAAHPHHEQVRAQALPQPDSAGRLPGKRHDRRTPGPKSNGASASATGKATP